MNHVPVIVRAVHEHHVLIATLDGREFPLPRIHFRWAIANATTTMTRRQYPLRLAYASTFNGCMGVTLDRCVVDIRNNPFTHGHLYVAMSRVRKRKDVRIVANADDLSRKGWGTARNVVWRELLAESSQRAAPRRKRPFSALPVSKRRKR